MREIRSPLDGILSPFAAKPPADAYAVQGLSPLLVADFTTPYYRKAGAVSTFDSTFTHSRGGNATMVDSDGLIKWAPHNLALNSATPATQSITVVSGADYTVEITGSGSVSLTGAGTGTVTAGNPVEITASTTTLTLTVTGTPSTMWAYRSDLGGMVNNPDRGDSYVPTTTAAIFQPRRGHHVYDGSFWVNEGLLLETEARTNFILYSEDFTDVSWQPLAAGTGVVPAITPDYAASPSGEQTASRVIFDIGAGTTAGDQSRLFLDTPDPVSGLSTNSFYAKSTDGSSSYVMTILNGFNQANITVTGEWKRFDVRSSSTTSNFQLFLQGDLATAKYADILLWGAQAEHGPTPSSYMPTAGATFTRPTESLQIAAADMPWPTPNVIGAELVDNGDFELGDNGDWTLGSDWSIGGGVASYNNAANPALLSQAITLSAGSVYEVTYTVSALSNGFGYARFSGGTTVNGATFSANGSYTDIIVAASGNTQIDLLAQGVFSIDNVSVREIDPLSVSLQMQGRITYADEGVEAQQTFVRWYDDANNYITIDLDTDSTDTGEVNFEQKDGTGGTGTVTADTYSPGILVPYNIASRNTSTAINGATDGTAGTEDTNPTALPDLSAKDFSLGYDYMGCLQLFRAWNVDIGDTGIEEASS